MKKIVLQCIIAMPMAAAISNMPAGANQDFQQWMQQQAQGVQQQKKEFREYRDKRDREFTAFLKMHWKAIEIVKGEKLDEAPKPDVMPVAPPLSGHQPEKKPAATKPVAIKPPPVVVNIPEPALVPAKPQGQPVDINFFGRQLRFYVDRQMQRRLSGGINKDTVADYWSALSRTDYEDLLDQLKAQNESLQLTDWAYAAMVHELAMAVNHNRRNESALLSWFLLAKTGYRARVAYDSQRIYLLVPSRQELFEVPYFTFGGKRFYAVAFDGNHQQPGQVFTYDGEYPGTPESLDMKVTPLVAASNREERRHLSFRFEGRQYNIDASYDRGRIRFFETYPQLSLDMYFSAGVNPETATPLLKQLGGYIAGMDEQQAVNFLLRFVQTAFKYETDEQQFGRENYLFPEETLYYPYSDCEDRAVLFAWLVRQLLGLDVVGVDYPGHVATAINFHQPVQGDSLNYQGKRYIIADPTYINARVGMSMPQVKQYKPTVISY